MLFKTFTGKELLDSSAKRCMEQYAEIFSQVVAVQKIKARKKRLPFYCI